MLIVYQSDHHVVLDQTQLHEEASQVREQTVVLKDHKSAWELLVHVYRQLYWSVVPSLGELAKQLLETPHLVEGLQLRDVTQDAAVAVVHWHLGLGIAAVGWLTIVHVAMLGKTRNHATVHVHAGSERLLHNLLVGLEGPRESCVADHYAFNVVHVLRTLGKLLLARGRGVVLRQF